LRYALLISVRLNGGLSKVFNASVIGFGNPGGFAELGFPTPWFGAEPGFVLSFSFSFFSFKYRAMNESAFAELGFCAELGLPLLSWGLLMLPLLSWVFLWISKTVPRLSGGVMRWGLLILT